MQKKIFYRCCLIALFVVLGFTSFGQQPSSWKSGDLTHLNSYFDKYCYSCHGTDSRERGGIELESMKFDISNRKNLYFWSRVHEVIKTGEMPPPKKKKQPTSHEKKKLLSILGRGLYKYDSKIERQMERRLSNKEIENVLIDVFGTYLGSEGYFGDAEGISGFDNQYTDVQISGGFMMSYNKFIDVALESFFSPKKSTPHTRNNVFETLTQKITRGGHYRV
ncbi:MAG: hypothetical protein HRT88_09540, partial [Lentisphaeraceae bacterium]|nr:hypothetical protein [Lentisphaeraceae bacterium]